MNQVANLKSLSFTWKRIASLLGVFPEVILYDIDFRGFFDVAFYPPYFFNRPFCGRPCCKTNVICISSPTLRLRSSLLSPLLLPPLILGNSLPNSSITGGCWFSSL